MQGKGESLNSIFSDKSVHSAEAFIIRHVDRWNELSIDGDGETWSKPKNMADWSNYLLLDILGDLCFGASLNTKEPQENPLKEVPHANAEALQFFYPVSRVAGILVKCLSFEDYPVSDDRSLDLVETSRSRRCSWHGNPAESEAVYQICRG